jgi:predicted permease
MWSIWRDIRFALRGFRQNPGFTAVAVVTLGLGIAASATVFGWINMVLLHPIPGASHPEQLATLEAVAPDGSRIASFPHPDFRDFQRMSLASGATASHPIFFSLGPLDHPRRVLGEVVSANFFEVLGVKPHLGRLFLASEDRDDRGAFPIAVVSYRFWKSYFKGNPAVVGRDIRVNGRAFTLVGVTPPEFHGSMGGAALDVWTPLSMILEAGGLNTWAAADRNARFLNVVVRLKPGVSLDQASAEARLVASRIAAAYPGTHRGMGARLVPLWRASYGLQASLRDPLRILMGVCLLVLLIACANVANLLMARAVTRRKEFGIRIALGAGRTRLVRQLLAEALLLGGAGAAFGVLLAQWMGDSMAYAFPALEAPVQSAVAPLLSPTPTAGVLAFTLLISIGAAVISMVVPAFTSSRMDLNETLKEGGRGGSIGLHSHRMRAALVSAEVALASMALILAGLAVRSFEQLASTPAGFDPRNVLVAHFHLSTNGYNLTREREFSNQLRQRLNAAPGVEIAASADAVPLSIFGFPADCVQVEGSLPDAAGVTTVMRGVASPGYFTLLRIPLLAGRDFTEKDDAKAPAVIIVNQTFARRYFGDRDPLGRKATVAGVVSTVVGVARDSAYRKPGEAPVPFFYGPFRQIFFSGHTNFMLVRARDPGAARAALRREMAGLDPSGGLYETAPLTDYLEAGLFAERVAAALLSALSLLALLLAAVGLYSVMAYAVNERTREIGVRMALGAREGQVLGMILGRGFAMAAPGLALGMALSLACVRLASSTLELPIASGAPAVFLGAALFLLAVALAACYIPARRAARVDPLSALHCE